MTCPASVIYQIRTNTSEIERIVLNLQQTVGRISDIVDRPAETVQIQTEENARDYFMTKMETALNRGLISREQFTPMFEHFFGPAPLVDAGEEVDASYHEVDG